jgi:cytochrome c553
MRIPRSAVVGSAAIAAVLIGILIGFPISAAKSATTPAPGPGGEKAAAGHGTREGTDPRIIARGKATFDQYCANCHGAEGKGDGIAGQNLPIKPQNLTEGRILNALPDHFLHDLIAHGGQAVGLSPLMPNFTPYLSDVQIGGSSSSSGRWPSRPTIPRRCCRWPSRARGRCSRSSSAT